MAIDMGPSGGGDFTPFIKFNAKSGRIVRRDRAQNASGMYESNDVDITETFKAIVDIASIKTGWLNLNTGGAPDKRFIAPGTPRGEPPSPDYKWGGEFFLKLSKECGGDVRTIASNSFGVVKSFNELHDAYLVGSRDNPDKLPVVVCEKSLAVKTQHGTNYRPTFKIVSWTARPSDLPSGVTVSSPPTAPKAAPATGSTPVGAPTAKAKQPELTADDDFG